MFSMKYTSPKLTPKKGRDSSIPPHPSSPSPLCVALDSPSLDRAGADSPAPLFHIDDRNATTTISDRPKTSSEGENTVNKVPSQSNVESYKIDYVESLVKETTNTDCVQSVLFASTSLVDITSTSNNHVDESKDSSNSCDHHDIPGQAAYDSNDYTRDDVANTKVDFDTMNYSGDGFESAHSSSIHLHDVHSLPEFMIDARFGYQRSISMEPMLHALPAESTSLSWMGDGVNPTSPMVYDLSARPIASTTMTPGHDPISMGSPYSGTTDSDIGGDAYFDEPFRHHRTYQIQPRSDSLDEDSMLPPRVNRTTANDYATNQIIMPSLPGCLVRESSSPSPTSLRMPLEPYPIPPPRQPFLRTHSLLDDCSDDEEDGSSSFFIVDSPTRHIPRTYSCFPQSMVRGDRVIQNKSQQLISRPATGISNASLKASNNIQQALFQTRHRRWDCQSALAGPHAQSKEVLDISNRFYDVARYLPDNTDGITTSVRLSVSAEAIRAAVLASGLWRTVRCVHLPQGLFWSQMHESDDVWALLKMLNSTLPMLSQIDFSGEIESADTSRRNEIVSGIMECLPSIVAIDGFVVEQLVVGSECQSLEKSIKSEEEEESQPDATNHIKKRQSETSDTIYHACGECAPVPMCGLSNLVDSEALTGILETDPMGSDSCKNESGMTNRSDSSSVCDAGTSLNAAEVASSHEHHEDRSERNLSLEHVQVPSHHEAQDPSPREISSDEDVSNVPQISSASWALSSSRSWGSNGSVGRESRPPPCPNSSNTNRLHPRLPTMPKGSVSMRKAGNRLKRRVLGLIPTVSIMDDDDDDDGDDNGDENSNGSDNSMDADRHADIL